MSQAFQTDNLTIDSVNIRIEYFYDDTHRGKPWEEYDGNVKFTRYQHATVDPKRSFADGVNLFPNHTRSSIADGCIYKTGEL